MFFHILKKDLKRKKTMNAILLLFIIMASMFLASSASNLKTVMGAVDEFMDISNVPDFFTIAIINGEEDAIADYLEDSKYVEEFTVTNMFNLSNENVTIKESGENPDNSLYERTNTLAVCGVPEDFMKVFDLDGNPLKLNSGEIAIPKIEAEANNLMVGDVIELKVSDMAKTFEIKTIVKDAVFGSAMMGFKRFYISEEDFQEFETQDDLYYTRVYSVNTEDLKAFKDDFGQNNFKVLANIEKQLVKMCYVFDMLISGILIIVSVCLILIAFLILRFTIVFTLQEDYKEIGIMKAIGIRNRGIRGLYLVKYLVLAVTGALLGLAFSFPFEQFLMNQVIANIVLVHQKQEGVINILCAAFIVMIVLLFCYMSTGKLNRFTAMEAIRSGSNGERFRKKNFLKLSKQKYMGTSFYMALNDILSNKKRFAVLCFIFCIGTLLILLPLSAINTLNSSEIAKSFSIDPSTVYIDNRKMEDYMVEEDDSALRSDLRRMEQTLKEHGIDSRVRAEIGYIIPCYSSDPDELYNYITLQGAGYEDTQYQVVKGRCPQLENEIMVTELTADEMQVSIGDSIYYKLEEETREYIITGLYQSMMNMGKGFRMNPLEKIDYRYISGLLAIQADVLENMEEKEAVEAVRDVFPEYEIKDGHAFINKMTGGVQEQIGTLQVLIVGLVLVINCLITVLMMKTMIAREHGEIAMLKSIGFRNSAIRSWQMFRILIVLICSIAAGILLSMVLCPVLIVPIFAMMGATAMELSINPLESYVFYPLLLLVVTGFSAAFCGTEIKKVDLKEINDLE